MNTSGNLLQYPCEFAVIKTGLIVIRTVLACLYNSFFLFIFFPNFFVIIPSLGECLGLHHSLLRVIWLLDPSPPSSQLGSSLLYTRPLPQLSCGWATPGPRGGQTYRGSKANSPNHWASIFYLWNWIHHVFHFLYFMMIWHLGAFWTQRGTGPPRIS